MKRIEQEVACKLILYVYQVEFDLTVNNPIDRGSFNQDMIWLFQNHYSAQK